MHAGVSRSRWRALEKTSLGLPDASRRDASDASKGAHQLALGAAAAPSQGHHLLEQLPLATAGLISSAQPPFFGTPEPWLGHLMCPEQGQLITRALVRLIPLLEQCKSTSCTTRWVLRVHACMQPFQLWGVQNTFSGASSAADVGRPCQHREHRHLVFTVTRAAARRCVHAHSTSLGDGYGAQLKDWLSELVDGDNPVAVPCCDVRRRSESVRPERNPARLSSPTRTSGGHDGQRRALLRLAGRLRAA